MSMSIRSRFSSFLKHPKFHVYTVRVLSCITRSCYRDEGDRSLILGGPRELIKTEGDEGGVKVVDIKRILKERLLGDHGDYGQIGGRYLRKPKRPFDMDDAKMSLTRDSILSLFDNIERDNQLFHTMATKYSKGGDDCKPKDQKDVGKVKYHPETEDAINKQIMSELNAAFGYLSIASFFGRTDVGKHGTHKFFMVMSNEEIGHALRLVEYQLSRGGTVKLCNISINESVEWCSTAKALEIALVIEKVITDEITNIICVAKKHNDLHTENLLITEFVTEQYESINKLAYLLARANRIGKCGIGDYMMDAELMQSIGHSKKIAPAHK